MHLTWAQAPESPVLYSVTSSQSSLWYYCHWYCQFPAEAMASFGQVRYSSFSGDANKWGVDYASQKQIHSWWIVFHSVAHGSSWQLSTYISEMQIPPLWNRPWCIKWFYSFCFAMSCGWALLSQILQTMLLSVELCVREMPNGIIKRLNETRTNTSMILPHKKS